MLAPIGPSPIMPSCIFVFFFITSFSICRRWLAAGSRLQTSLLVALLPAGRPPVMGRLHSHGFPQAKSPDKGVGIVAYPATGQQFVQLLGVPSPQPDLL